MIIEVTPENLKFFEALSSETKIRIVSMLAEKPMNIKEIAASAGISSAIAARHVQQLEEAGILKSANMPGIRGMQKVCSLNLEHAVLIFKTRKKEEDSYSCSVPVGVYSGFDVKPVCGLASRNKIIGLTDDPRYFADPEHVDAQLVWFSGGWVEYQLPNYLHANQQLKSMRITVELCSEAPGYNDNWPSDITFFINDREIGMWTCPGDYGSRKGMFTPDWWTHTQYGTLKTLTINDIGSYIDGLKVSDTKVSDLEVTFGKAISFRIASLEGSRNPGGVNIFGKGFGNYNQDINVTLEYQQTI